MSWYVIEGPDQTGKTTLARGLERRGWRYLKATEADTLPVLALRMAALVKEENVVWDRAHLSEEVHHPNRVDMQWHQLIEQLLSAEGAVCALLTKHMGPHDKWENDQFEHANLVASFEVVSGWSGLEWVTEFVMPTPIEGWTDVPR